MGFFLLQTIIISLTGVMAPGPITAVTVGNGTKSPHAGALVAVGHGIVEFPLMICIYFGLGNLLRLDLVKTVVFALGGMFLLVMGTDMLSNIRKVSESSRARSDKPLVAGMLLSMGNVYFLLWWLTVGATMITKAVAFGIIGIIAFTLVHWLCDLIWLYFLSAVSYKGGHVFGIIFQKVIFAVCGVTLIIFGGIFLFDAVRLR